MEEDTWNKIIDIRVNGSLSPFQLSYFLGMELSSPFFENLPSIVFTPPSVPPVLGDRNPQGREDVTALRCCICPTCPSPTGGSLTHSQALALSKRARDVTALRCSEPLRFMVVGPSKVCARFCGLGPHEEWCLISNHDVCNE